MLSVSHPKTGGFPRLNRRGPIEAILPIWLPVSVGRFPRLNRRGPIEAKNQIGVSVGAAIFPRLNRRGPIEAIRTIIRRGRLHAISAP